MGNTPITTSTYKPPETPKPWRAYCVLDIGSVSSGYAYSFEDNKDVVWLNKNWAESLGYTSFRTPSAVLCYNSKRKQDKFGFEAIDEYMAMQNSERAAVNFRYTGIMSPSDPSKAEETTETKKQDEEYLDGYESEESGEEYMEISGPTDQPPLIQLEDPPKDLLSEKADLAFLLAKHCKEDIERKYGRKLTIINWSFVVPFEWPIVKKQKFRATMKKKFFKEFPGATRVSLVTTTESLWTIVRENLKESRHAKVVHLVNSKKKPKGIILVNTGATRLETSLLVKDSGNPIVTTLCQTKGGSCINFEFQNRLKSALGEYGEEFVTRCKREYPAIWLDFMLQFEMARKSARSNDKRDIQMDIGFGFAEAFMTITGRNFSECMSHERRGDTISITRSGKLLIPQELVTQMFTNLLDPLLSDIYKILDQNSSIADITGVLVTGGLGDSAFLHEHLNNMMTSTRPNIRIFTPEHADIVAAKGATSKSRAKNQSPRVYAVTYYALPAKDSTFIEKVKGLKVEKVVNRMCPIICTNDDIKPGKVFKFGPFPLNLYQKEIYMEVYEVSDTGLESAGMPKIKVLKDKEEFYLLNGFGNRTRLGKLSVSIPTHGVQSDAKFNGTITLIMDSTKFLVKMRVSLDEGNKSWVDEKVFAYSQKTEKKVKLDESVYTDKVALQRIQKSMSVHKETTV